MGSEQEVKDKAQINKTEIHKWIQLKIQQDCILKTTVDFVSVNLIT